MIRLSIGKKNLQLTQHQVDPTVYLDHWALRQFSENKRLSIRLIGALKSKTGTLALSWVNLAEFLKMTNKTQARKAEDFVEAILPQVYLLEADPFTVISRENVLLQGGPPSPPHADQGFLKVLVTLKSGSPKVTARGLFTKMQGHSPAGMNSLADTFVQRLTAMRGQLETDSEFRTNVQKWAKSSMVQRGTRDIVRELARAILIDKQTKITRNHAMDFYHAVVPISYCDLVLLDKYWETQVGRVRTRFEKAGVPVRMASVFSGKHDGIEQFLDKLES